MVKIIETKKPIYFAEFFNSHKARGRYWVKGFWTDQGALIESIMESKRVLGIFSGCVGGICERGSEVNVTIDADVDKAIRIIKPIANEYQQITGKEVIIEKVV